MGHSIILPENKLDDDSQASWNSQLARLHLLDIVDRILDWDDCLVLYYSIIFRIYYINEDELTNHHT